MTTPSLAHELEQLAERIARIRAVGRNGDLEPFHVDRSQARRDAQLLARWARSGRVPGEFVLAADRDPDGRRESFRERR